MNLNVLTLEIFFGSSLPDTSVVFFCGVMFFSVMCQTRLTKTTRCPLLPWVRDSLTLSSLPQPQTGYGSRPLSLVRLYKSHTPLRHNTALHYKHRNHHRPKTKFLPNTSLPYLDWFFPKFRPVQYWCSICSLLLAYPVFRSHPEM